MFPQSVLEYIFVSNDDPQLTKYLLFGFMCATLSMQLFVSFLDCGVYNMVTVQELYDLSHSLAGDWLGQFTYPWEALSGIKNLILQIA